MSTTTLTISAEPGSVSLASTLAGEAAKLRTLRSTWWSVGATVTVSVLLAAVAAAAEVDGWADKTPAQRASFDPTSKSLVGVLFAAVIVGVLAVRSISAEHSTGMIRTTYAAVPHRRDVLVAKALAVVAIALPVTAVSNLAGFAVGQRVLASEHADATFASPGALRAIAFGSVAVVLVALVGLGLGELLRRTATATMVLSVAVVGTQIVAGALPSGAQRYLPSPAIEAAVTTNPRADLLAPGAALLVLTAYAAAALVPALALVNRRDP